MRLLVVTQGEYGRRILQNIRDHAPATWEVSEWKAPLVLPPIIDEPSDYVPDDVPPADLILSLGQHPGTAQLLPELAKLTGARALIAPMDHPEWLPEGLARQLAGWLAPMGVSAVFPKPFCSLTEDSYGYQRETVSYQDDLIAEFAHYFGRPLFHITCENGDIVSIELVRDAACGCARFVAQELLGVDVNEAEQAAGLLHHHFPCLASMEMDADLHDTLMHISGRIMKEAVEAEVCDAKEPIRYFVPDGHVAAKR